jgi:hypothetical protein
MDVVSEVEYRVCRGCGARFERTPWALDEDLRASPECRRACGEVAAFAYEHPAELGGLHQLVVDAYGVQHAGEPTRPIRVVYGLVGLYLALECGVDGPGVRDVHSAMGRPAADWPSFDEPRPTGGITVADVLHAGRDAGSVQGHANAVRRWAGEVWAAWSDRREDVVALTERLFPGWPAPAVRPASGPRQSSGRPRA